MSQRFFIAILPTDSIQTEVIQIQNYFRDRYTNNKSETKSPPHITLIAPFNLSSDRLQPLQIELEKFAKTRSPIDFLTRLGQNLAIAKFCLGLMRSL